MVIPRSLTFLTAFHGGWDFGCCRIGLAASAMDFESGFPPDARAKPLAQESQNSLPRRARGALPCPVPLPAQARGCKGRSPLHEITLVSPFPAGLLRRRFSPCRPGSEAGVPGAEPLA